MNETRYADPLVAEILDAQPQPVFWMKPVRNEEEEIIDFEYGYCNEEMYRFTGLRSEQLLGNRISTTLTLSDSQRGKYFEQIRDVYQTGKKVQETLFNPLLNKYYSFLRSRVMDGVLTVIQDRSAEYTMIHELQRQKTLFDNVLQQSPSGISVVKYLRDADGNLTDALTILANEAAARYTGFSRETLLSTTAKQIDPNLWDSPVNQMCLQALSSGEGFHTQYFLEATNRWLEVSVSRLDESHLIHVFTDISSSKQVQLAIEESAEKLNTVVNASQAGMFTLTPLKDTRGEIIDFVFGIVNEAVAAYIGETAETLQGALASIYFPAYKENGLFEIYKNTHQTGAVHDFDFHYEDGYDVYFRIHTVRTGDEVLVTFTDHTALKRAQRELEATVEELKRSNRNLEEFAYAASHDLKEPIRKIHFFSDRLKKQYGSMLDANGIYTFERMEAATERMRLLVDDLLSYSQVSLRPRHYEEVDLNQVLSLVASDLELDIEQKQAQLLIDPLPSVAGHMRQLQQLFQNLLSNALKYTRTGVVPEIRIRYSLRAGHEDPQLPQAEAGRNFHVVEVSDNGIGFDQKDAEKIFNVFQRLHGNSEYKGTGVGLSIARKVAENHKGYLFATGEPGKGSSFRLLLPAETPV